MSVFGDIKLTAVFTMISVVAGALVTLGSIVTTIPLLEPYAPATRDYVRQQLAEASKANSTQYTELSSSLAKITDSILESRLVALDGQIQVVTGQLGDIEVKLHSNPNDQSLQGLHQTIKNSLDVLAAQRHDVACQRLLAKAPGSVCSP